MGNESFITVVIFTQNHDKYIRQAVESVLCQKTKYTFSVLVLVSDSTDATCNVLSDFQTPIIEIKKLDKAKSYKENTGEVLSSISTKYIAFLDGDDYWISDNKIECMLGFMEKNPDYTGAFHDVEIINEFDNPSNQANFYAKFKYFSQIHQYEPIYYPWHCLERKVIQSSAIIFRTEKFIKEYKNLVEVNYSGSWMLLLFLLKHSKFKYFNDPWSVYRNHNLGLTKQKSHILFVNDNIKVLKKLFCDDYYKNLKEDIHKSISNEYFFLLSSSDLPTQKSFFVKGKLIWLILKHYFLFLLKYTK
jgi:glycosyltransferase involved in cell wall biosynthesis